MKEFIGKEFIWAGDGKLGYDCVTLSKAMLEKHFDITIHSDFLNKNPENELLLNPTVLRDQLSTLFNEIEIDFMDSHLIDKLKPYDILLFRFNKIDSHVGVYVGKGVFVSILEQQKSDEFCLTVRWQKRLSGVFRYGG